MKLKITDLTRQQIKRIAEAYAESSIDTTGSMYAETYGLCQTVFYKILKKAVVESIVSEEVAEKIAHKSAKNALMRGGQGGKKRTLNAHDRYLRERKVFEFGRADKILYTVKYAESSLTADEFCKLYCMPRELLNRTMKSAIVDGYVSMEIVNLLKEKSIKNNGEERALPFFEMLLKKRKENDEIKALQKKEKRNAQYKKQKQKKLDEDSSKAQQDQMKFQQDTMEEYGILDEMQDCVKNNENE